MSAADPRVANYDSMAAGYDRRYGLHEYAGVKETLLNFLSARLRSPENEASVGEAGALRTAVLEVGCGTGHWLEVWSASLSGERPLLAGVEPSSEMIARARVAAPGAHLVRARAEGLPWADATFDRVYCINALHHFTDRAKFFAEARRILKPGGGLLTIGKDPHTDRDAWWVYDYFPETVAIDRERFARVRTLRGELAFAGFAWTESFEADRIEALMPATEALATGVVDRAYTSQLTVLSDEEFESGVARLRAANAVAGDELPLVTDFQLYATVAWV